MLNNIPCRLCASWKLVYRGLLQQRAIMKQGGGDGGKDIGQINNLICLVQRKIQDVDGDLPKLMSPRHISQGNYVPVPYQPR